MSARQAVWEVARREIVERSRSRALHISLAVLLLLAVGGAVAAARLRGHTPTDTIAVAGARSVALEPAIQLQATAAGRRVHLRELASQAAAAGQVRNGTVALALIDGDRILVKSSRTGPAVREVQNAVAAQNLFDRLRRTGLTQAQALNALSPAALPIDVLAPNARNTPDNQNLILFCVFALYAMVMFSGQAVAQGVTEEKSSRVVELLLTTISPRRLLAGKVLGIGAIGLGLMLLPGAAALVAGSLAGGAGLPPAAPEAIALVVLWFVLGYILFSVAYAAVGATVSRQEDLATAQAPLLIVAIAGLVLANIVTASSPDGTLANVTAFLPPFSPMIVPARMVVGHMSWLAFTTAVAVDILATAGLILLAARIYERSILQTGARVKLAHVLTTPSHLEGAEAAYRRADERGSAEGAFNLGVLLEDRGELEGAEAAYRRADERGSAEGASNLGVLLEDRGELEGAEAAYRRADERGDGGGASNLGVLLEERGELEGAEAAYRRADERGSAEGAFNLGDLLEQRGDLQGAEAAYRRADERGDGGGAFNFGVLLQQRGELEGAEAAYRRAVRSDDPDVAGRAVEALQTLTGDTSQNRLYVHAER
jgi:ABC-2 type transport system permease protein